MGWQEVTDIKEVQQALRDLDVHATLRKAFGNCPTCGTKMVAGYWLRWCPDKKCGWVGPK